MSLSSNIRTLRKRAGLTQIELAKELEISIATLRRWEAGETAPTGTRIKELAERLNVTPEDIVANGSDSNDKKTIPEHGMLVFDNGVSRIEIPPTEKGYELFNKLVESMLPKQRE